MKLETKDILDNLIAVEWIDAAKYGNEAYTKEKAVKECIPVTILTVGYILDENNERVLLSSDITVAREKFRGIVAIPKQYMLNRFNIGLIGTT